MRLAVASITLFLALAVMFQAEAQTKGKSEAKAKSETKATPPAKSDTESAAGFAVAPMILTDEGCARDYIRVFQSEGVELRKKLIDLQTYGCLDTTATAIFAGISVERRNLAIEKGSEVYFRRVFITFDAERTKAAVGGGYAFPPGKTTYSGWIPEENFYAVSPATFDQLVAEKKVSMTVKRGAFAEGR